MENQNHCFVVMYLTGECDDQTHVPCAVFMNLKEAEDYINVKNSLLKKLELHIDNNGYTPEFYESRWDYAEAMTREHGFPRSPDYNGAMYCIFFIRQVEWSFTNELSFKRRVRKTFTQSTIVCELMSSTRIEVAFLLRKIYVRS